MAALGLTTWSQFGLGNTTYSGIIAPGVVWTPGPPQVITHTVASSVNHPSKFMGRGPASLEGTIILAGSAVTGFVADVQTATERHASWVGWHAFEIYCHVNAGTITGIEYMQPGTASSAKYFRVSFSFTCHDQRLYKAADDSVLLGG